ESKRLDVRGHRRHRVVESADDLGDAVNVGRGVGDDEGVAGSVGREVGLEADEGAELVAEGGGVNVLDGDDPGDQLVGLGDVFGVVALVNGDVGAFGLVPGDDLEGLAHL